MEKFVKESYTEQVHILTQADMNGYKRLFGGRLMSWIDIVAAVVARRHSCKNVTTASVDKLEFRGPARENDTIYMTGTLTYVGRTSMEVCVRAFVEELTGERKLINKAYVVLVALDENDQPVEVPRLVLQTDAERKEWEGAEKRNNLRKKRKEEKY